MTFGLEAEEFTRRLGVKGGRRFPIRPDFQPVIVAADMSGLTSPPIEARALAGSQRTPAAGQHAAMGITCRAPGHTLIESVTLLTNTIQNRYFMTAVDSTFVPSGGSTAVDAVEIGGAAVTNAADMATISPAQLAAFSNVAEMPFGTTELFSSAQGLRYIVPAGRIFIVIGAINAIVQCAITWKEFAKGVNPA